MNLRLFTNMIKASFFFLWLVMLTKAPSIHWDDVHTLEVFMFQEKSNVKWSYMNDWKRQENNVSWIYCLWFYYKDAFLEFNVHIHELKHKVHPKTKFASPFTQQLIDKWTWNFVKRTFNVLSIQQRNWLCL